jgi:hypothetical protein
VRRAFWVALGLGAGVTVGVALTRWARRTSSQMAPANVGRQAMGVVSDVGGLLREAAAEFRRGMAEKEAEVRAAIRG